MKNGWKFNENAPKLWAFECFASIRHLGWSKTTNQPADLLLKYEIGRFQQKKLKLKSLLTFGQNVVKIQSLVQEAK